MVYIYMYIQVESYLYKKKYIEHCYNSLHASGEFCRPPIAFCKQFEPKWRPTECRFWSGSKLFDTLMVVLGDLFVKLNFEESQQTKIKTWPIP